jgi:hypothetical protein
MSDWARTAATRATVPWRVGDLTVMAGANLLGLIGLLVANFGGGGQADLGAELPWLRLGIGAVVVAGAGNALWLMAGVRAVAIRRRQLLERAPAIRTALRSVADQSNALPADAEALVAGPQMTRYHRTDCPAAAGRPVAPAPLDGHLRAGLRPCGICRPSGWGDGGGADR